MKDGKGEGEEEERLRIRLILYYFFQFPLSKLVFSLSFLGFIELMGGTFVPL